jgi:hypothetical protein
MKKISLILLLTIFLSGILPAQKNQKLKQDNFPLYNVSFTYTGCSTIYDATSNAIPQNIIQDPNNPNRIHIVCMYAPPGDGITFPNRKTKYYYSTNIGQSWSFICNIPDIKSGYPAITLTSDGRALIANHGGAPNMKTTFYIDIVPGLGSFTSLIVPDSMSFIWPRLITTSSITLTNKFVSIGVPNTGFGSKILIGQSLSASGVFSQGQPLYLNKAESYSIARGSDGRIGIVYRNCDSIALIDYGSIFFIESTDNGTSFSSPLKIFKADMLQTGDSLGAYRGIQIVYQGNVPKVVFEEIKQTEFGNFYPNSGKNCIRFWSPNLPGSDPYKSIILADTSTIGYHPYFNTAPPQNNDALTCICRPTIGTSADGTGLFVAFMVPSNYKGGHIDTVSFTDVWFMYSVNYGLNWISPSKITPESPIKDWSYPSISPSNDNNSNYYYVNMLMLSDSLPGSYIAHEQNGESNAKYMFGRVEIPRTAPSAPTLLSPPNGSQNQPRNPNMKWYQANNAVTYRLQLALNSIFTNLIFDSANIIQTNLQLPQNFLSPATTIYWRVIATNSTGSSGSAIWNFTTDTVPFYSVSGTIRYKDNNQPVNTGYVKIMKINKSNLNIITFDSTVIQSNGSYVLQSVRQDVDYYISPYPNSCPPNDSYVPTYYPSEILWERATPINVNSNLTNMDVNVYRVTPAFDYNAIEGTVYGSSIPPTPLNDAVLYAKKDSLFYRFSISDLTGHYRLSYLTPGQYKIYISRLGYKSDSSIVTIIVGQYENQKNFSLSPFYTGISNIENTIPTKFNLYQNYPNPFNPVTKIKFDIPKTTNVVLKIYDITGRLIVRLINTKLQPSEYSITWDASTFASGLYFLRMETNDYIKTQKMILIK